MRVAVYLRVATREQLDRIVTKEELQKMFDDFVTIPIWRRQCRYENLIRS